MVTPEELDSTRFEESSCASEDLVKNIRVLLVEDDKSLRRYLEVVLQRAGYQVISASDGIAAMRVALSVLIDIVVTDAIMPNLGGYELCKFLKSSPQLAHLPIVLLTALERKEERGEAPEIDAFLAKPVSPEALIACIDRLVPAAGERTTGSE